MLALKDVKGEISKEHKYTAYVSKRFLKVIRKNIGFQRRRDLSRSANGNYLCQKYGKPSHLIKDYPMQKMEHKKYDRGGFDKGKQKYWVPDKSRKRVVTNYVVKQALDTWGDSFNDFDES